MRSGQVIIWNYINGQPLKECANPFKAEIPILQHLINERQAFRAVCVASGHNVLVFNDTDMFTKEKLKHSFSYNTRSITALVHCGPSMVAYAIEGGEIILYSVVMNQEQGVLGKFQTLVTVEQLVHVKDSILIAGRSDGVIQVRIP